MQSNINSSYFNQQLAPKDPTFGCCALAHGRDLYVLMESTDGTHPHQPQKVPVEDLDSWDLLNRGYGATRWLQRISFNVGILKRGGYCDEAELGERRENATAW